MTSTSSTELRSSFPFTLLWLIYVALFKDDIKHKSLLTLAGYLACASTIVNNYQVYNIIILILFHFRTDPSCGFGGSISTPQYSQVIFYLFFSIKICLFLFIYLYIHFTPFTGLDYNLNRLCIAWANFLKLCTAKGWTKKSRIWETTTLSTDADSRTDTNLKRLRDLSFFYFRFFFFYRLRDF